MQGPPGPEGEPGLQGEPGTKVNVEIILLRCLNFQIFVKANQRDLIR